MNVPECMLDLPVFNEIDPQKKFGLLQVVNPCSYQAGEIIFRQGQDLDQVYFIKKGRVILKRSFPGGEEITLGIAGENDIMGSRALTANKKHIATGRAMEEVFLCTCSMSRLKSMMKENHRIAIQIIQNIGDKLEDRELKISELAAFDVRRRLLSLLERLADKFGRRTDEGIEIDLNLTHRDMADFIGASRVMVSNILQEFKGVSAYRGRVVITDPEVFFDERGELERSEIR